MCSLDILGDLRRGTKHMPPFPLDAVAGAEIPPELRQLSQDCLVSLAEQRPQFVDIMKQLTKMKGYRYLVIFNYYISKNNVVDNIL